MCIFHIYVRQWRFTWKLIIWSNIWCFVPLWFNLRNAPCIYIWWFVFFMAFHSRYSIFYRNLTLAISPTIRRSHCRNDFTCRIWVCMVNVHEWFQWWLWTFHGSQITKYKLRPIWWLFAPNATSGVVIVF